ncbi:Uncharacterized conserved protein [Ceraceosorus bombacis]|uniref:Uncharacterized conserved protein n=1 Tax=Ceraceosorus bombacis TaxID=401625 RepID=A0A0P1BMX7_9BASI|nr:Uncharacterized conserved protein [Ceraceosorus bombacis]
MSPGDEDDDGDEDGEHASQHSSREGELADLRAGIIMPGMGSRVPGTTGTTGGSSGAPQRGREGFTGSSSASVPSGPAAALRARLPATLSAAIKGKPPQQRFKGTPARSIRYSLPVRSDKPVRTSKTSGKHVLLPSESQLAPLPGEEDDDSEDEEESSEENEADAKDRSEARQAVAEQRVGDDGTAIDAMPPNIATDVRQHRTLSPARGRLTSPSRAIPPGKHPKSAAATKRGPVHSRAPPRIPKQSGPVYHTFERLAPQSRQHTPLPRLTSYSVGPAIHIPTLAGFLRREHGVRPRLYDECAYVVYFKPLLPGFGRAEVRSAPEPRGSSPGAEDRRERQLEEQEESGYLGSYFAQKKEEEEDPQGYIHGGEGKGGDDEAERDGESRGSNGRASSSTDHLSWHRERREENSPESERRHLERLSEAENETETEGEREDQGDQGGRTSTGITPPSQPATINEEDEGIATPRALEPRTGVDDVDALLSGEENADDQGRLLGTSLDAVSSEDEYALRALEQESNAGVLATEDELLSADEAGARDMLLQQQAVEDGDASFGRDEVEAGMAREFVEEEPDSSHPHVLSSSPPRSPGRKATRWDESLGENLAPSRSGRRPKKNRRASGPNQASHNHDTSRNMLTSRGILEALHQAELIVLPYGVLVMYNLSAAEERSIINDVISSGCVRGGPASSPDDEETEAFHFCYDPTVPAPRIFNDFFTFRQPNHLLKVSLAHAIAQSTKLSVFEESMQQTLELTSHIPKELASSGELKLKRREALRLTGRLFKLRVDVNLTSNVLDTPELFWSEASLKALYDAIREYLEIDQRVENLNERLAVANDLLEIIHEHISNEAMSKITWIIIMLIIVACLVACGEISARLVLHSRANTARGLLRSAAGALPGVTAGARVPRLLDAPAQLLIP